MKYILTLLLLISTAHAQQLNVKLPPFNAVGNGAADDYIPIQKAIDSAVKTRGTVYIPAGRYKISQTLIVANWSPASNAYAQAFVKIIGDDMMHSTGVTLIQPTFKDAPALALHLNKGSLVQGLFFDGKYRTPAITVDSLYRTDIDSYGDTSCRDSRYSPYTAIAIDPFRGILPPDGGYPTLQQWYRGPDVVSGSTGIRVEDCTFRNFTIGAILSPNGKTLNNELITFENIRVNDCKFAFVGCQAQEKLNRLINWEIWGSVRCAFVWAKYGQGQPGHYVIDGVNIAGRVVQLIHRPSQGFFPIFLNNIFAESLGKIGYWNTTMNDAINNSTLNFYYYRYLKAWPDNHFEGNGVMFNNVHMRYYVYPEVPILMKGKEIKYFNSEGHFRAKHIKGQRYYHTDPDYQNGYEITRTAYGKFNFEYENGAKKLTLTQRLAPVKVGDIMVFYQGSNLDFYGMGEVETVTDSSYTITYCSPGLNNSITLNVGVYKSK